MPTPITPRGEALSAVRQRLMAVTDIIGQVDVEIARLEEPDRARLDVAAQFLRVVVDEFELRVDTMLST